MKLIHFAFLLLISYLIPLQAEANYCDIFDHALGINKNDGTIYLHSNSSIKSSPNNSLKTKKLNTDGDTHYQSACESSECLTTGSISDTISVNSGGTEYKGVNNGETLTLTGGNTYKYDSLVFNSGSKLKISGDGAVTIHIKNNGNFGVNGTAIINAENKPLIIIIGSGSGTASINSSAQVNAYIYANRYVEVSSTASVRGAIVANKIRITDYAQVTYDSSNLTDFGNCSSSGDSISYCSTNNLSDGYQFIDPDGSSGSDQPYRVYCEDGTTYLKLNVFGSTTYSNMKFKQSTTNHYASSNQMSHYGGSDGHIKIDIDTSTSQVTLSGITSFSNINLTGTPFAIDQTNSDFGSCSASNLTFGYNAQVVKTNTSSGTYVCNNADIKLEFISDYTYTDYILNTCKLLKATYSNLSSGHYYIDPDNDSGTEPFIAYCKMDGTGDGSGWTLFLTMDGYRTDNKSNIVDELDTCSNLGLNFFAPRKQEDFDIARNFLLDIKNEWQDYTGTMGEYFTDRNINGWGKSNLTSYLFWPYGPMGVYHPDNGGNAGSSTTKYKKPNSDELGQAGWVSILSDLGYGNSWWVGDVAAGSSDCSSLDSSACGIGSNPWEPNGDYDANNWMNYWANDNGVIFHYNDQKGGNRYNFDHYICMAKDNYEEGERAFTARNPIETRYITGNYKMIGNVVMCETITSGTSIDLNTIDESDIDVTNNSVNGYSGNLIDKNTGCWINPNYGDNWQSNMTYINTEGGTATDGTSIFNSSEANLTIPSDAEIVWAGLYWQGVRIGEDFDDTGNQNANVVYFKTPEDTQWQKMTAHQFDYKYFPGISGTVFHGYANITDTVNKTDPNGNYKVGNIQTKLKTANAPQHGAWSIVAVYEREDAADEEPRNIVVYDGFRIVYNTTYPINISGFQTPKQYTSTKPPVYSQVSVFSSEGDKYISGDYMKLKDNDNGIEDDITGTNSNNIFDSTLSYYKRKPFLINNMGIDIDTFDVGQDDDSSHQQILGNDSTSATITLSSSGDFYIPSTVVFSTNLYQPDLCYEESFYYEDSNATYEITEGDFDLLTGNTIYVKTLIRNRTSNGIQEKAEKVELTVYLDDDFEYDGVDANISLSEINSDSLTITVTDTAEDDQGEFETDENATVVRVGRSASTTSGGDFQPDDYQWLQFKVDLDLNSTQTNVEINNTYKIEYYNPTIGVDMPKATIQACEDTSGLTLSFYNPYVMRFDAVDEGAGLNGNIKTKIADCDSNSDGEIKLDMLTINDDNTALYSDSVSSPVRVKMMTTDTGTELHDYGTITPYGDNTITLDTIHIASANQDVHIQFEVCTMEINGTDALADSLDYCDNGDSGYTLRTTQSSDNFAIRPDHYTIITSDARVPAGDQFTVTFQALDANGTPTSGYNESASTDNSFTALAEDNTACDYNVSRLGPNAPDAMDSVTFTNGEATINLTYSEIGTLEFSIEENASNEFAITDADDTSDTERYITKTEDQAPIESDLADIMLTFTGDDFLTIQPNNINLPDPYLYMADDVTTTNALINMEVHAIDSSGTNILENFNTVCGTNNTGDITLTYGLNVQSEDSSPQLNYNFDIWDIDNGVLVNLNSDTIDLTSGLNDTAQTLPRANVYDGVSNAFLEFNIVRDSAVAHEPTQISPVSVTATTNRVYDTGTTVNDTHNFAEEENATFIYARLNPIDAEAEATTINDQKNYFEAYCKSCTRATYGMENWERSINDTYWFRIPDPGVNIDLSPAAAIGSHADVSNDDGLSSDHRSYDYALQAGQERPHRAKMRIDLSSATGLDMPYLYHNPYSNTQKLYFYLNFKESPIANISDDVAANEGTSTQGGSRISE